MARDGTAEEKRNRSRSFPVFAVHWTPLSNLHNLQDIMGEAEFLLQSSSSQSNCRARLIIHICRSSRNSDTGFTPQTNRWSRARVQAT